MTNLLLLKQIFRIKYIHKQRTWISDERVPKNPIVRFFMFFGLVDRVETNRNFGTLTDSSIRFKWNP